MENKKPTELARIIRERRSVKKGYTDQSVPKELVLELLNDAVYAPNHGLREPWRFIFVPAELKESFVEEMVQHYPEDMAENRRNYFSEPTAFLIVIMPEEERQKQRDEDYGAVGSMIQNFQLLAWERGLGVVWKTNVHIYDKRLHERLGLTDHERIAGYLHLGYFDEVPEGKPRIPVEEKFTIFQP
ncbi:nitroreductase family protein [Paenibacillus pini]|uniref:Nitroreductase n=1 Tax=Paenibacillus pini JCM 16418 TaxID=1236976 RepID=W7YSK5_9BACL|nr:nitroreductase [Paenibacillus pini]GAF07606.1 nitroreductase [Paenibacillus pini JCM 16418]